MKRFIIFVHYFGDQYLEQFIAKKERLKTKFSNIQQY